ncbi:MAG: class I SAM-dependent methyltransferase, partial [Pseudomonadota bacterium]
EDAPIIQADAATCLLTLHVIADDATKIETLKQVRARLKPGALFALVDNCIEIGSASADRWLNHYVQYAVDSGFPREQAELFRGKLEDARTTRSPEQEEQLLRDAGFHDIELYYVGLSWRGWIARA